MIFEVLYNLYQDWRSESAQSKNHLSNEGEYAALCGQQGVESMGGSQELRNGEWYMNNPITYEYDIKMGATHLGAICKKCVKIAESLANNTNQGENPDNQK